MTVAFKLYLLEDGRDDMIFYRGSYDVLEE